MKWSFLIKRRLWRETMETIMKKRTVLSGFILSLVALSVCLTPAMAISINNGKIGDGAWSVDVLDGGSSFTGEINPVGPIGPEDVVSEFSIFVDTGADGSGVKINNTNVTTTAFFSGLREVTSEGNFAGPNGTIEWKSVGSILRGTHVYNVELTFTSTNPFGIVRVISYLDSDVRSIVDNDILVKIGIPGTDKFGLLTIDKDDNVGVAQSAGFNSAENITFKGWAASNFKDLKDLIEGTGASYSLPGIITGLPPFVDPRFPGIDAFGPEDITSALAFDLSPDATQASVVFSLIGLAGIEECTNGIDDDDDGLTDCGDPDCICGPGCIPPATETSCTNGLDDDCDGLVDCDDPDCWVDNDGDGCLAPPCGEDCKDNDPDICPALLEADFCNDNKDNDCDGLVDCNDPDIDADGDHHCPPPCGGDCDDDDKTVFPGAPEECDEKDNDCDGAIDKNAGKFYFRDVDGDGFGSPTNFIQACTQPIGFVLGDDDCDDKDPAIHPDATEVCNDNKDNDCDGRVDCEDPNCFPTCPPELCSSFRSRQFSLKQGENACKTSGLRIWNCKRGSRLEWQVSASCPWLTLQPTSGVSRRKKDQDRIKVCVDTSGLDPGIHECTISVTTNGGDKNFKVKLRVRK